MRAAFAIMVEAEPITCGLPTTDFAGVVDCCLESLYLFIGQIKPAEGGSVPSTKLPLCDFLGQHHWKIISNFNDACNPFVFSYEEVYFLRFFGSLFLKFRRNRSGDA